MKAYESQESFEKRMEFHEETVQEATQRAFDALHLPNIPAQSGRAKQIDLSKCKKHIDKIFMRGILKAIRSKRSKAR